MNEDGVTWMPDSLPCTIEALDHQGVFLVDNGIELFLMIFFDVKENVLENVRNEVIKLFGSIDVFKITEENELPYMEDNLINVKVHNMIAELQRLKFGINQKITIVSSAK